MAKKQYTTAWMGLNPDDDPSIEFGGSQGTSGFDSQYSFSGIDNDIVARIQEMCDDTDLASMDQNEDLVITLAEFEAWLENNPWFEA